MGDNEVNMTGEPDALKGARPVRKGIERKGLVTVPRSQSTLLKIREEQLGASHPSTATSLNNLAGLYESQGKYSEAEPLLQRAVQISVASLGMEHPQTQQIMSHYLTLLSHIHTNDDVNALLALLGEQDDDTNEEVVQE